MYGERTGKPFTGKDRERLVSFLKKQGLDYDDSITYSYTMEEEGEIIATGSSHGNVIKCIAISKEHQGENLLANIITHLTAQMFQQGITHYFGFTKPKNRAMFCNMGLHPVAETENVLLLENKKNGLKKYLAGLKRETELAKENGRRIGKGTGNGAIVANCNPFTLGHRYLIESAAEQCEWLHLFVLSEEQGMLTAEDRFEMVRAGVSDISNVILHRTSDYLISPAVFPTYFIKDKAEAYKMNCMLDIEIFRNYIARELEITKRYVGSEPDCSITRAYNVQLKEELPSHGILVQEVERLMAENRVISASKVREAWKLGALAEVADMIPDTTRRYLEQKKEIFEVTLPEILEARERRVWKQRQYLSNDSRPLICFMLNIPGTVKVSEQYYRAFQEGIRRIKEKMEQAGYSYTERETVIQKTGYEYYISASCGPEELKRQMTAIEDGSDIGRLYDIDVLNSEGKKIGRSDIGMLPRKCLLCEKESHVCSRSRSHKTEELLDRIQMIIIQQIGK